MDFKQPHILFLKGINIDDLLDIENIYHKELLNNIKINSNEINVIYDKIPKHFINLHKWKKNTNIRCWFCTLKFKNTPWFIIENINYNSNGTVYDIKGNFCSVGCLQAYINIYYDKRENFDIFVL